MTSPRKSHALILSIILLTAFVLRLTVRLSFGEAYFWKNSYSDYYSLAENLVAGKGLCFDTTCAWWPPLYPLSLALAALAGKHYLLIVIPQALMGAGKALCAFLIGRELFNPFTGILASLITTFYPYYVMHDTALQETGMVTFWTALSVFLLLRAKRINTLSAWLLAGVSLAAIILTRASLAPTVLLAVVWSFFVNWRKALFATLALVLTVCPWLIRTWRLTGSPVLSSQTGRSLWIGNNPDTFSHYPSESIDRSTGQAYDALTPQEHAELERLSTSEIAESDWFARRAVAYIRDHPWLTVRNGVRKILAGFSWTLNPNREPLAQAAYFTFYFPVSILGVTGMFLARHRWRECSLIYLLFVAFIGVTAVFWAHISHRSYLDLYLIVFAASVITRFAPERFRRWVAA